MSDLPQRPKSKLSKVFGVSDLKRKVEEEEGDDAPGLIYEKEEIISQKKKEIKLIHIPEKKEGKRIFFPQLKILFDFLSCTSIAIGYQITLKREFYEYLRYFGRYKFFNEIIKETLGNAMEDENPYHFIKNYEMILKGDPSFVFPKTLHMLGGINDGIINIKGQEKPINIWHGDYPLEKFMSLHGLIFVVYIHLAIYFGKLDLNHTKQQTTKPNGELLWNERFSNLCEFIRLSILTPYLIKYEGGIRLIINYECKYI